MGSGTDILESARAFRSRILTERDRIESGRRIPEDIAFELAQAAFFPCLSPGRLRRA